MSTPALKYLYSLTQLMWWLGLAQDFPIQKSYTFLWTAASEPEGPFPSQVAELLPSGPAIDSIQYKGSFEFPADGEDPFSHVAILRAGATALKSADLNSEVLQDMSQLVTVLIQEEAPNIQLQSDLQLIDETKNAVDVLHSNPSLFPSTRYTLREGSKGELHVRTEVPFWVVDSEAALALIVQDVIKDVLGVKLPRVYLPAPGDEEEILPIEFGYDATMRRTVKLSFGDSMVTVTSGKALKSGGAVGVSHGLYTVTVGSGNSTTDTKIKAGPFAVESSVSADSVTQSVSVGDVQVVQQATPANRPASLLATYKDLKLKVNADPEGKRHGAEFGNKNFDLSVARDFDDRINIIKQRVGQISMKLETDLSDDRNHAFSGKLTAQTPQTGEMVFGGGFDAVNTPTAAVTLQSTDMGISFNGSNKAGYTVRIGPFVFDVAMSGGLPEFTLQDIQS